ncbi:hypothetical protein EYF80_027435 [Liparis tanakae]|uniref:Uncharacterized protein n=1 Tax=Liparis tanakae TaxID=230148 RepID=A0A4Z2H8V7_9TELE|nr:hypothetical protein EYF80_027435 [Liparis tanakae]
MELDDGGGGGQQTTAKNPDYASRPAKAGFDEKLKKAIQCVLFKELGDHKQHSSTGTMTTPDARRRVAAGCRGSIVHQNNTGDEESHCTSPGGDAQTREEEKEEEAEEEVAATSSNRQQFKAPAAPLKAPINKCQFGVSRHAEAACVLLLQAEYSGETGYLRLLLRPSGWSNKL